MLLVSGPTGIGKSALATQLAQKISGVVVNIDSVQLYKGFSIGAAKLLPSERRGVPHVLLDAADAARPWSVKDYISAVQALQLDAGKTVFCGGTTHYISALFGGMSEFGQSLPGLRDWLMTLSEEELECFLRAYEPELPDEYSRRDRRRKVRYLELMISEGRALSDLFVEQSAVFPRVFSIVLCTSREYLYARINRRCELMMEQGLVAETEMLLRRYGAANRILHSLGYREAVRLLLGQCDAAQALAEMQQGTRRYAKRQMTFWRNEPAKRGWQAAEEQIEQLSCLERKELEGFRAVRANPSQITEAYESWLADDSGPAVVLFLEAHPGLLV